MASKTWVPGTVIDSAWLQDVNDFVYDSNQASQYGVVGDGVTDDTAAIQAALNAGVGPIKFGPGVYIITSEIVIPDGSGIVGVGAHWKRRTGYIYDATQQTIFKYTGSSGLNTCVIRASNTAVGTQGTDFNSAGDGVTDDLTDIVLRDFHVDANNLADYGIYVYRAGNQATLTNLTAEKSVKANHVHLGCFAAFFGTFGSYESRDQGVYCGWDIFGWGVEATNFAYYATFHTCNNGTSNTYVAGSGTDQDNSGGKFSVGRGSFVHIVSESNFGRACTLSQFNIGGGAAGPSNYFLDYIEGNADGPYVDYRDAMDSIRLICGFIHPGNGTTLDPQNIKIESKTTAGVVTADSGPTDFGEWLVIEGAMGDLSGVGFDINSNTFKYIVRDSTHKLTFSGTAPGADDFVPTKNLVGAAVSFSADASPTIFASTNGTLTRTGTGTYLFTFDRAFNASVQIVPMVSPVVTAALDTRARLTSLSATTATIRTYNAAGALADTGDRISAIFAGTLEYTF